MQPNPETFICFKCIHQRPYSGGCNAFPDGIPEQIIFKNKHNKPIKGQKYTGLAISFYDNGQLAFAASYKDGKLNGWWRKWEENSSLFLETQYVDGEMVSEIDFN